ncbi:AfsR/SARP family transcriptional regulator [Actinoplanes sp. NBRC 103695]|uniref:AfsR/SARP family transcriptional regulator n=1 Tax=Actinoplanes sp. NBRC 103695 TaxID=3032202 RepID=UPI0024A0B044|nr:AfsR/SARP family transcriptional regulator [Actinoplanes sp. NBRC 103695]GLZ02169.1 hypothetical protein Acsp02_94200 [Actinoplanes sp. NBRC 103695]
MHVLDFGILGELHARAARHVRTPRPAKQRALLALLLLHHDELMPTGSIIDALWAERPPRSARAALQMHVTGVRRALHPGAPGPATSVLETRPRGYLLRLGAGSLDLRDFRRQAATGHAQLAAGDCAAAADAFHAALSLWRGPALADLTGDALDPHIDRLECERLTTLQARIGADLCQGRSAQVIGELVELCARHPLIESLHAQLMLASWLSGRGAQALEVFTRARRILIDEACIEPGPALRTLQQAILKAADPDAFRHHGHR